jgi:hypothetical protein
MNFRFRLSRVKFRILVEIYFFIIIYDLYIHITHIIKYYCYFNLEKYVS